jgi:hypothetical protein
MVKIKDRRRGPDAVIRWINYTAVTSWIILIVIFFLVSLSKPGMVFNPKSGLNVGGSWDIKLLRYALYMVFPLFILSIIGIVSNAIRLKRKSDKVNKILIINLILSLACIIYFFVIR